MTWIIYDWGKEFKTLEEAEEFLRSYLGDDYEKRRQNYEIGEITE